MYIRNYERRKPPSPLELNSCAEVGLLCEPNKLWYVSKTVERKIEYIEKIYKKIRPTFLLSISFFFPVPCARIKTLSQVKEAIKQNGEDDPTHVEEKI